MTTVKMEHEGKSIDLSPGGEQKTLDFGVMRCLFPTPTPTPYA